MICLKECFVYYEKYDTINKKIHTHDIALLHVFSLAVKIEKKKLFFSGYVCTRRLTLSLCATEGLNGKILSYQLKCRFIFILSSKNNNYFNK